MNVPELRISSKRSVFKTPWFELVEKTTGKDTASHYSISTGDYVSVFAATRNGTFPLVQQFRPAVEQVTLELPSGHVDEGQTPEQAARNELREETGFIAHELIPLARLSPDTGRLGNWMWCFFAPGVEQDATAKFTPQPGIEPIIYDKSLRDLVTATPAFSSALSRAVILMAVAEGHIKL
jgi:ADP-ribose pyrophosphatase YjhB (NUDIX family)